MPPVQVLALGQPHIGAGRRQPGDGLEASRRQPHAIIDLFEPMLVVAAATGVSVQQPATDIGVVGAIRALFLELVETAFAATVAKALPLRIRHFRQRLALPKWDFTG